MTALILAASVGLSVVATAEPFNDRGARFIDVAPAGSSAPQAVSIETSNRFNNRGSMELIAETPRRSRRVPTQSVVQAPSRFNDRDTLIAPGSYGRLSSDTYTRRSAPPLLTD
jgi:hypothetical protein